LYLLRLDLLINCDFIQALMPILFASVDPLEIQYCSGTAFPASDHATHHGRANVPIARPIHAIAKGGIIVTVDVPAITTDLLNREARRAKTFCFVLSRKLYFCNSANSPICWNLVERGPTPIAGIWPK